MTGTGLLVAAIIMLGVLANIGLIVRINLCEGAERAGVGLGACGQAMVWGMAGVWPAPEHREDSPVDEHGDQVQSCGAQG